MSLLEAFDASPHPDATAFLVRAAAVSGGSHDAYRLLARYRDPKVLFVLRQWLSKPDGEQDQMLRALGRLADAESEPAARTWLGSRDVSSQLHAAYLLAALGRPEGADRLLSAIEESPVELKRIAAGLLTELDLVVQPAVPARLGELLDHEDVYVRLYAARALADRGDPRAWARLQAELAKKLPFVADEVLDIAERAPRRLSEPVLRAWLAGADPLLRRDLERIVGGGG